MHRAARQGRWTVAAFAAVSALVLAQPAAAQPPPPNPSDDELRNSRNAVTERAKEVGRLSGVVAELNRLADAAQAKLAEQQEVAFQRLLELRAAQDAAVAAEQRAAAAQVEKDAAAAAIGVVQDRMDEFAASAMQRTLDLGPIGLLTSAQTPDELVARAEFSDIVAQEQLRALDAVRRAGVDKVNAESSAKAAQQQAEAARTAAAGLSAQAEQAVADATTAVATQEAELTVLDGQRSAVEAQLDAARSADGALRGQREQFVEYQRRAAAAAEEERRRAAAATAADGDPPPTSGPAAPLGPQFACRYGTPRWGPVKPWVSTAGQMLRCRFGIGSVGGVGPRPNPSDHPAGLALDFFVNREQGEGMASCVLRNQERLAVKYVIYRQRINSGTGWRQMEDRGSPVANHMEHVHVSFRGSAGGSLAGVRC